MLKSLMYHFKGFGAVAFTRSSTCTENLKYFVPDHLKVSTPAQYNLLPCVTTYWGRLSFTVKHTELLNGPCCFQGREWTFNLSWNAPFLVWLLLLYFQLCSFLSTTQEIKPAVAELCMKNKVKSKLCTHLRNKSCLPAFAIILAGHQGGAEKSGGGVWRYVFMWKCVWVWQREMESHHQHQHTSLCPPLTRTVPHCLPA